MIVDCHTHLSRSEHWSEELASESVRARARPATIDVKPDSHWEAVRPVDRAVVFGLYARHVGLVARTISSPSMGRAIRRS